jgi:hypothetical protein
MVQITRSDLKEIQVFLARVLPRGYHEEERLVALIEKIDRQLHFKEKPHGSSGQTGASAPATKEAVRHKKIA